MTDRNSRASNLDFVPLGNICLPASLLQRAGRRRTSYPFDWVFSHPFIVRESILRGFEQWLDMRELVSSHPIRRCGHRSFGIQNFFNHHDPTREPDRSAYARRIDRFLTMLASEQPVVFVTTANLESLVDSRLLTLLRARHPLSAFLMLDLRHDANSPSTGIRLEQTGLNCLRLELHCAEVFGNGLATNGTGLADAHTERLAVEWLSIASDAAFSELMDGEPSATPDSL